mgnify:CR=1 FL=1
MTYAAPTSQHDETDEPGSASEVVTTYVSPKLGFRSVTRTSYATRSFMSDLDETWGEEADRARDAWKEGE